MIDLATLTGAVKVALGFDTAGYFTSHDDFSTELLDSSKRTFEPIWRLPISKEHRDSMKGAHSDLNNSGGSRYGGASQAAAFLERFVEKDVKWVHFDISGAAKSHDGKVGNGYGVALLLDYIKKH